MTLQGSAAPVVAKRKWIKSARIVGNMLKILVNLPLPLFFKMLINNNLHPIINYNSPTLYYSGIFLKYILARNDYHK